MLYQPEKKDYNIQLLQLHKNIVNIIVAPLHDYRNQLILYFCNFLKYSFYSQSLSLVAPSGFDKWKV